MFYQLKCNDDNILTKGRGLAIPALTNTKLQDVSYHILIVRPAELVECELCYEIVQAIPRFVCKMQSKFCRHFWETTDVLMEFATFNI